MLQGGGHPPTRAPAQGGPLLTFQLRTFHLATCQCLAAGTCACRHDLGMTCVQAWLRECWGPTHCGVCPGPACRCLPAAPACFWFSGTPPQQRQRWQPSGQGVPASWGPQAALLHWGAPAQRQRGPAALPPGLGTSGTAAGAATPTAATAAASTRCLILPGARCGWARCVSNHQLCVASLISEGAVNGPRRLSPTMGSQSPHCPSTLHPALCVPCHHPCLCLPADPPWGARGGCVGAV